MENNVLMFARSRAAAGEFARGQMRRWCRVVGMCTAAGVLSACGVLGGSTAAPATPTTATQATAVAPTNAPTLAPRAATSPAPSPAAQATATSAPVAQPAATSIATVWVGNTDGQGVYVRKTPVMADRIKPYADGTPLTVVGEDVDGDGQHWKHIKTPDGVEGYVPSMYTVDTQP